MASLDVTTTPWERITRDGVLNYVDRLDDSQSIEWSEQYGTHNYHPLPVNLVRAEGIRVYDGEGNEYIDCIGSYSAVAHGHLSPFIVKTVQKQLEKLTLVSRAVYSSELAAFLKAICDYCELDMACPMNTGAEAIETCIKLARKWGYVKKGVATDRAEIIVAEGNFHGRTTTIVGFSSEPQYRELFGPYGPGFKTVPFGDASAIEAAITENTVAVMMEPIQAEGGIIVPYDGFLHDVCDICARHNVLVIWDEIQTGFARTGRRFVWNHEDAKPDLLAVGKPLGGGLFPVSAAVGKQDVMDVFEPGDHGSTFGGNPLGSVIAIAALAEMENSGLAARAEKMGNRLMNGFRAIGSDNVKEVRGRGLLIGLEVQNVDGAALTQAFLNERVLTKETRHHTFRFAPPLTIQESEVDEVIARVSRALATQ
ncbi:MAG TPA: ornithine--oxo-acid transaminase [Fimbriimonadaceae bacterium]|nr:ornithine--oxo-acid transaminase [Fimbriimonadaceae bacterium]